MISRRHDLAHRSTMEPGLQLSGNRKDKTNRDVARRRENPDRFADQSQ